MPLTSPSGERSTPTTSGEKITMKTSHADTIVAIATPQGRGGVAVIRVSGPAVNHVAQSLLKIVPKPRHATLLPFFDEKGASIDEGIALYFPAPHSFTGEDVLELQGHGGPAVMDLLVRAVLKTGARLARPGEFSERAFLNDKLDLAQAEAIADLIEASTEQAARSAMRSLQGVFSERISALVEALIRLRTYVEAAIDFAEEEIDFLADQQVSDQLTQAIHQLEKIEAEATQGSLLRDGITVVIAGVPNVGKSSLLNALSGRDSAIVTDIPGTTRDILREVISIQGVPLHIIDTAGLRDSDDVVEQEGIRRAQRELSQADVVLFVVDAMKNEHPANDFLASLPAHAAFITVRNKIDLTHASPALTWDNGTPVISLSAKTQLGIDLLRQQILASVGYNAEATGSFSARRRHLDALARAKAFLLQGQEQLQLHKAGELLAEDLRLAQAALCEITGEFTSDDLLGRIFSSFCIGK